MVSNDEIGAVAEGFNRMAQDLREREAIRETFGKYVSTRGAQSWADVHPTLQSRQFDNVFVIGDAAQLPQAASKQACNAIDMGALAAANATRLLAGRPLKPFKPAPKPVLIAFGDLQTCLVAGRIVLASKALAGAKEGVYQLFMAQMAPGSVLTSLPAADAAGCGKAGASWPCRS